MKKTHAALALTATIALALTACSGTPETPTQPDPDDATSSGEISELDELVAAAQAEGTVRVYSSLPEGDQERLTAGFTDTYGITVESLRLGGNTLPSRFDAETQAGSPSGEVLISTALDFLLEETDAGTLVAFEETGVEAFLDGFPEQATLPAYGDVPMFQVLGTGFLYNTETVKAADIPDTWSEFAETFAGEYCAVAPDTSEALMVFMAGLRDAEGDDALTKLGEGVLRWYPSAIPMNEAVASGECAIGINSAKFFAAAMQSQGASVEFAPAPTAVYPVVGAAVSAAADHPNAARLFLHYALSEEGGALVNDAGVGSYGAYDADQYPSDFQVLTPEENKEVLDSSEDILRLLGY